MSDIANHLGISKRTLYEVFKDKEDLLHNCLQVKMCDADSETEKWILHSENVIDALMHLYAKHLNEAHQMNKSLVHDLRKYHPKLYKIIEDKQKESSNVFIPLFEKGIQQKLIRDDINVELLAWVLTSQFKALWEYEMPLDKYSFTEYLEAIILNFTRGIATVEGQKKIDELSTKIKQNRFF